MVIFGNDKVTLFNRAWDDENEEEIWSVTILAGCNLVATQGQNISKSGLDNADTVKLYVAPAEQSKAYVKPKTYEAMTDRNNSYTFRPQTDFFILGAIEDAPVTTENFYELMLNTYDDVYRVTTVDEYADVMPHLEIGGK